MGSLVVTGAGSSVNMTPNGAAVGEAGTGTLTVTAGATAVFASLDSTQISALAVARAGTGTVNVTHFYTDSESERAGIVANRPDLVAEGIGFYEPHQNYAT